MTRFNFPGAPFGRAEFLKGAAAAGLAVGLGSSRDSNAQPAAAPASPPVSKPPTAATRAYNAQYRQALPFNDTRDFEAASRGRIAALPDPVRIPGPRGAPAWDMSRYSFLNTNPTDDAPDTVNPSLWRMAKLNMNHGLYQLADGLWQVRGYDLSVMTIMRGERGYVVVDPFVSTEVAQTVWQQLVVPNLGDRPVTAVIYTHSHGDHFGGVRGVVRQEDVDAGRVRILAPHDFTDAAAGENVIAGNAMSRRGSYMYGLFLAPGPAGHLDNGLGKASSNGTLTLILPTDFATRTGETITLDGVELRVIMAPESEAPAEFMFYLPRWRAFCAAEDATHTLHNLYTLRGAKVRDGLRWSKYLQEALDMFGAETEIVFASHHWPTWGNAECVAFLKGQRDMYRYLHDQVMRMANNGLTPLEIGERLRLPPALATRWDCRSYYGSVYHDAIAQYNLRLGFYDAIPAHLHQHEPVEAGKRYVAFMGGAANLLRQAQASFEAGDYRWVAEVVNHLVFAEPGNQAARNLLADTYEQLGYQAESGPWRNVYLCGALELRQGVRDTPVLSSASPDVIRAMPFDLFLDFLGVRLNAERVGDARAEFNLTFTDLNERWTFGVENAAIHYSKGRHMRNADTTITTTRAALDEVMLGARTAEQQVTSGALRLEGDPRRLAAFTSWLDEFPFWFAISEP